MVIENFLIRDTGPEVKTALSPEQEEAERQAYAQELRICDRNFETIPAGSSEIGHPHGFARRFQMFQFPDGSVHDLTLIDPPPPMALSAIPKKVTNIAASSSLKSITSAAEPKSETTMSVAFRNFQHS
jgi:hypothetical protein